MTARVRALREAGIDVDAVALVPEYGAELTAARRVLGAHGNSALRLDSGPGGAEFREARFRWSAADLWAVRRGRPPSGGLGRATRAVVSGAVETPRPDVVVGHGMYSPAAGEVARRAARGWDVPFVVGLHGSDVIDIMPHAPAAAAATLRDAAATVYVSSALREQAFRLGAPVARSHVVPNGVDLSLFHPGDGSRDRGVGDPRLLFVGNLLPIKGADRLPGILAAVRRRHPGATLDVLGDGPLAPRLSGRNGVRLHGRVSQAVVADRLRDSDVLLVPSRDEGWGCVVSEAYACGVPVVATRVGGLVEAVLDADCLVPEAADEDTFSAAFATTIGDVLSDPPPSDRLAERVADAGWGAVARRELDILAGALS